MPLSRVWRRAWLALGVLLLTLGAVRAETVTLGIDASRDLARQALLGGQPQLALAIARALLDRDPTDAVALLILAAAETRLGEPKAGLRSAVLAFRNADDPVLRYEAARYAAAAALADRRFTLGQFWLRRAAQLAPAPQQHDDTAATYRAVQAERPWTGTARFNLRPTTNLNQGSSEDQLIIDGVPTIFTFDGAAQALSGLETGVDLSLAHRFAPSPTAYAEFALRLQGDIYTLSDAAKQQAPGASGSDFSYVALEAALTYNFAATPGAGAWSIGSVAGTNWYGGQPLGSYLRLELGKTLKLSDTRSARLDLLVEQQWRDDPQAFGNRVAAVQSQYNWQLKNGSLLALRLGLVGQFSKDRNAENTALSVDLRYTLANPLGPAEVTLGLNATARDFPVYFSNIFNVSGRQDLRVGASVELFFPKAEVWGLAPVLSIAGGTTTSNVSRYQSDYFGVQIGLRSVF